MKFEAEGQEFAKFLQSLEQLQFKLEKKILGFRNMQEKFKKSRQQQQKRKTTKYSTTRPLLFHFLWLFDA